jgi:murein DD-endopeptidase MepM/ murein hydrolase activator NlpD
MARRTGMTRNLTIVVLVVLLVVGGVFLARQFEWNPPVVTMALQGESLGLKPFNITVKDEGKGLAYIAVSLITGDSAQNLFFKEFDTAPSERTVRIQLDPSRIKLKEGPAILRITAGDRSYWSFFRGNKAVVDRPVRVDLTPPTVEIVDDDRYITYGGSAMIVYRSSPDARSSEIKIGQHIFPAYKGIVGDPQTFVALFAHPYDVPTSERASILVEDNAGNVGEYKLSYTLRNPHYRSVNVQVSDDFITHKIRPLLPQKDKNDTAVQQFVAVNRELRRQNEKTISKACSNSKPEKLWQGPFLQLSNSKVESNFADHRSYIYQGNVIDHAYHLGYDLAVTRHYPVGAANAGIVVLAGPLGIYGNTVILDHGLGVCTLYAHLSSIQVSVGEHVSKGQKLGHTGQTGLALGDHLHYGVYLQGVAVLPLEWWDPKWISSNVLNKLAPEVSEAHGSAPR